MSRFCPLVNGLCVDGSRDEISEKLQVLCVFYRKDRACLLSSLGDELLDWLRSHKDDTTQDSYRTR